MRARLLHSLALAIARCAVARLAAARAPALMGRRCAIHAGAGVAIGLLAASEADSLTLRAGDLVVSYAGASSADYAIRRVDTSSGAAESIPIDGFVATLNFALEATREIVVADPFNGIVRIDPETGARSVVSSDFVQIGGIAVEQGGRSSRWTTGGLSSASIP